MLNRVFRLSWGGVSWVVLPFPSFPVSLDTWERMELTTITHSKTLFEGKTAGQRLIVVFVAFRKGWERVITNRQIQCPLCPNNNVTYITPN